MSTVLRGDILSEELTTDQKSVKILSETQFVNITRSSLRLEKTKTPDPAKSIIEVMDLIELAVRDYDERSHTNEDGKVTITYEQPDRLEILEAISISLTRRQPGAFAQGRPWEADVRNRRPLMREELEDPDNPGYKRAVMGYFYDNRLTLTCWARTNKAANARALWLENVMEEYTWFFVSSGVNRLLYEGRGPEIVKEVSNNKVYGRPIEYFVRTEKLRAVSQKELEEIIVRLAIANNT